MELFNLNIGYKDTTWVSFKDVKEFYFNEDGLLQIEIFGGGTTLLNKAEIRRIDVASFKRKIDPNPPQGK